MAPHESDSEEALDEFQQRIDSSRANSNKGTDGVADVEQRIKDWAKAFYSFQDHEELAPHHNTEINKLFSQTEMQHKGEIIYYFDRIGSMRLEYNEERYAQGTLMEGSTEVNPGLKSLYSSEELEELIVWPSDNIERENDYLEPSPRFSKSEDSGKIYHIRIPRDYDKKALENTIDNSIRAAEKLLSPPDSEEWSFEKIDIE